MGKSRAIGRRGRAATCGWERWPIPSSSGSRTSSTQAIGSLSRCCEIELRHEVIRRGASRRSATASRRELLLTGSAPIHAVGSVALRANRPIASLAPGDVGVRQAPQCDAGSTSRREPWLMAAVDAAPMTVLATPSACRGAAARRRFADRGATTERLIRLARRQPRLLGTGARAAEDRRRTQGEAAGVARRSCLEIPPRDDAAVHATPSTTREEPA